MKVTRRRAYLAVIAACAIPRLGVLLYERANILATFEKSHVLAQMFLRDGTFGYVPGHPSAYTQPLYGWFLIPILWIGGFHWWSIGFVQLAVAVATALLVLEIGRRFLTLRIGLIAAVISTLQPYLVWHDLHGNREILDQLLGAGIFGLALLAAANRSVRTGVALGAVSGLAILSNTRLVVLPLVFCAFLLWRGVGWAAVVLVPVLAAVVMSPWVIRNKLDVGCFAITTDARGLWKANNVNTYSTLAAGMWIDQVVSKADIPQRNVRPIPDRWLTPEEAGDDYKNNHRVIAVPECAQTAEYEHLVFQFWEHHPGEKVKLAAQATEMLWNPRVGIEGAQESGVDSLRHWVEPLYTVPLFLLAIAGLFVVPLVFRVLAAIFVAYETLAAWVFAGTTRYRVPWDFVLALLAAAALERAWEALAARRGKQPVGPVLDRVPLDDAGS
ncbi:MAG TPA: glycosyltransferase family 39 protein [Gaiellaceae bacterium]|nr:glycosyltransferase family 39 protein [Gaiellaceae bacterium]